MAAAAQWVANFAMSTTFPWLADIGLTVAYGLYAVLAVLSFLFVWRFSARDERPRTGGHARHRRRQEAPEVPARHTLAVMAW